MPRGTDRLRCDGSYQPAYALSWFGSHVLGTCPVCDHRFTVDQQALTTPLHFNVVLDDC